MTDKLSFGDYSKIFVPGAPVYSLDYLFGRDQERIDLVNTLNRPGLQPIVVGNRGVGKTTLVKLTLPSITGTELTISCNAQLTYSSFVQILLNEISQYTIKTNYTVTEESKLDPKVSFLGAEFEAGYISKTKTIHYTADSDKLTAWDIFKRIQLAKKRLLIVLDNYDLIPKNNTEIHQGVANLIKTTADLSGQCYDSRIIVIGIGRSAESLIGKYESIGRHAREIYLGALKNQAIDDFLSATEMSLHFEFEPCVKEQIVQNSFGFPYYTHSVCLCSLDAMLKRDKQARRVIKADYENGVIQATKIDFRTEMNKYKRYTRDLNRNEMMFITELVYSMQPTASRLTLQKKLLDKGVSIFEFNTILVKLQQERQMIYVSRNRDDIRFVDPLMAPFIKYNQILATVKSSDTTDFHKSVKESYDGDDENTE